MADVFGESRFYFLISSLFNMSRRLVSSLTASFFFAPVRLIELSTVALLVSDVILT